MKVLKLKNSQEQNALIESFESNEENKIANEIFAKWSIF